MGYCARKQLPAKFDDPPPAPLGASTRPPMPALGTPSMRLGENSLREQFSMEDEKDRDDKDDGNALTSSIATVTRVVSSSLRDLKGFIFGGTGASNGTR